MVGPHESLGANALRIELPDRRVCSAGCEWVSTELAAQRHPPRLPAYSRLDLRADRTFTYRKSRLTLFLEVVNVMNRDNYRRNSPGININTRRVFEPIESLFPLLPVAGVLIEF